MSEQKVICDNFPYQVIDGEVWSLEVLYYRHLLPEEFLIKKPLVPLLIYLTSGGASITNNYEWCNCAAEIGDLEALQWLMYHGALCNKETCFTYATKNGHLEVLQWLRAAWIHSRTLTEVGVLWDEQFCSYAAWNGHLEVLKWGRENGAPWNEYVCANAALNGHFELLKWARAAGAPWDEVVCFNAAFNKHFGILKWAYVNNCPCKDKEARKAQELLLADKDINWSLQCKERWNKNNQELFCSMIEQVGSNCNKVTYDLLPTGLSNLIVHYL